MKHYSFLTEDLFYKYNDGKSTLYHLSYENLNNKILTPRVPKSLYHKDEDHVTKRICFSTSISRALHGAPPYRSNVYYVHKAINVDPESIYKPSKKQVFNIDGTNEVWILKPVKVQYIGLIFKIPDKTKELTKMIDTGFEKFKDFSYEWEWISNKYDPPYCINQILEKYPKETIIKMLGSYGPDIFKINDKDSTGVKVHKWRARTGIELVHPEPSIEEQIRVRKNWELMTPKMKKISDKKCKELYGCSNEENYKKIMSEKWGKNV